MRRSRALLLLVVGSVGQLVLSPTTAGAVAGATAIPAADLAPTARVGWLVRVDTEHERCTGSLIQAEWVLTAAHCADGSVTSVLVGDGTTPIAVDDVEVDPQYDDGQVAIHDVAVLHLAVPSTATPVALGLNAVATPAVGTNVDLLGWGLTSSGGSMPSAPSEGSAALTGRTNLQLTTSTPTVGCGGDSGGPVHAGGAQVAVISAGDAACTSFTVSSRLSASRTFLESTVPLPDHDPVVQSGTAESHGGQAVTFTLTATSHDGTPLGADAITDVGGDAANLACSGASPISCTFTPSQVGSHTLQLTITDGFGSSIATWEVEVVGSVGAVRLPSAQLDLTVDEQDTDVELEVFVVTAPTTVDAVVLDLDGVDATVGDDVGPDGIEAGTQELVSLTITGDDLAEGDEHFTITPQTDHPFLEPVVTTVTIRDDDDGTIGARRSIVAESAGLTSGARLRVPYGVPSARSQTNHAVAVTCAPPPGARFVAGTTTASCHSTPGAARAFTVTVQAPTAPGSITRPGGGAVSCTVPGSRIRVGAAGFRAHAATTIGFVAGNGSVAALATPRAGAGGRVSTVVAVPMGTVRGDRQLVVTGPGTTRDRVRSFDLRVAGRC